MWFDTIVDSAMAATITIDVAELNPPQEREHRQALFFEMQGGHRQHEQVRVGRVGQDVQPPHHRDRHHEQAHGKEVGREGPGSGGKLAFINVFDHQNLKHARQGQEGGRRQEGQADPTPPRAHLPVSDRRGINGAGDFSRPTGDAPPDHENPPDRQQGDQLDHRFDRDGGDNAVVAFVGVQIAGAEGDGKDRKTGGHPKRGGIQIRQVGH